MTNSQRQTVDEEEMLKQQTKTQDFHQTQMELLKQRESGVDPFSQSHYERRSKRVFRNTVGGDLSNGNGFFKAGGETNMSRPPVAESRGSKIEQGSKTQQSGRAMSHA